MTKDELIKWLEKEIPDINDTFPKCHAYKIALATLKAHKQGYVLVPPIDYYIPKYTDCYCGLIKVAMYDRPQTELDEILNTLGKD